jgi:hypothetical protein
LISSSDSSHLQQIFTGFSLLARAKFLDVSWTTPAAYGVPDPGDHVLIAVLNDELRIAYDVLDTREIDRDRLASVDFYCKRSCAFQYPELKPDEAAKIRPLGLNYEVYPDHIDLGSALRVWQTRSGLGRFTGVFRPLGLTPRFVPRQHALERRRSDQTDPFVVFLSRAWDPQEDLLRNEELKQERLELNSTRAACIRALRDHFGERTIAGLMPSPYAARTYPELQVHDAHLTDRGKYQELIRRASVCVTGVERLFAQPELTANLMSANADYYQRFLRPDKLVMNSLRGVLADVQEVSEVV